jgi:hypothetical protein
MNKKTQSGPLVSWVNVPGHMPGLIEEVVHTIPKDHPFQPIPIRVMREMIQNDQNNLTAD